jgi:hypothetical protein
MSDIGYVVLPSKGVGKPVEAVLHPGDRKAPVNVIREAWEESLARGRARIMVVYCNCVMYLSAATPLKVMFQKYLDTLTSAHKASRSALEGQLFI